MAVEVHYVKKKYNIQRKMKNTFFKIKTALKRNKELKDIKEKTVCTNLL